MTDTDLITSADPAAADTPPAVGDVAADSSEAPKKSRGSVRIGLSGMVLSELRVLAGELGIKGTSGMRKGDLIAAIRDRQAAGAGAPPPSAAKAASDEKAASDDKAASDEKAASDPKAASEPKAASDEKAQTSAKDAAPAAGEAATRTGGAREGNQTEQTQTDQNQTERNKADRSQSDRGNRDRGRNDRASKAESNAEGKTDGAPKNGDTGKSDGAKSEGAKSDGARSENPRADRAKTDSNKSDSNKSDANKSDNNKSDANNSDRTKSEKSGDGAGDSGDDRNRNRNRNRNEDEGDGRGRRGRRFRERRRGRDRDGGGGEPQLSEDDVVAPVAGILDVLDNYAFVRTSGYLAGPNDVYVSMNMVRKNGLRRGDAITGAVKVPREGENPNNQRQKFNPLVRLDTVNGGEVEAARKRPEFNKLTPLYPNQRLRLETTPERLSTRVIDLIMPIGKGQRALIVSPPKAGKTTILQDIANAITTNNPECHLMVVLVDERPEEVTDMTRSVRGEVIASTFDRPPSDHTAVAELAIERAKRLVETGMDVVVLLDSITRLGRAYNNSSPASGRILSGGVDSTALYPPKRFLGAARNIENGGSLTIIATAMVETGSTGDTVIFEEFKGTGNAELKLDRKISERRVFPAVDVNPSSTRKDELLLAPDEFAIVHKLRRLLSGLDSQAAIDLLMSQLKKTKTNVEFLMQVQKNAPGVANDD